MMRVTSISAMIWLWAGWTVLDWTLRPLLERAGLFHHHESVLAKLDGETHLLIFIVTLWMLSFKVPRAAG